MDTATRRESDALTFLVELAESPFRHDFYQTLRRLECIHADKPRWGESRRPVDDAVRFGQDPDVSFAPAPLASFGRARPGDSRYRLQVRLFGLFGPNGPLPIHLTEYARERLRNAGDPTFSRFADMLQHRFIALFYRAWAQAQPHVNRDRPDADRFAGYVASLLGVMTPAFRNRDTVPEVARLFNAGALVRHVRNPDGLASILQRFFGVAVRVEEFVGHWMVLGTRERTVLGTETAVLGRGAVAGGRVWDAQHKFRLHIGPLTLAQYESFLPGGARLRQVVDWVRFYLSFELDWDIRLLLQPAEVPPLTLDGRRRLGWTTWVGERRQRDAAADLSLQAETLYESAPPPQVADADGRPSAWEAGRFEPVV
jgi:type VI secretion system protein ImpH